MSLVEPLPTSARRSVRGHLRLDCSGADGNRIVAQSFAAPVHIGKPAIDGSRLVLQVVTPTAGLLDGDSLDVDVRVREAGALVVTSPSALRLHTMPPDGSAAVRQRFAVGQGSFFEYLPHLLIPQTGSSLDQRTLLQVDGGACALLWELLTPGRVASGERLAFRELAVETEIVHDGRRAALERFRVTPERWPKVPGWTDVWVGTCLCVLPQAAVGGPLIQAVRGLHADDAWAGVTRLDAPGALMVRVLAESSPALWRTVDGVRAALYGALGERPPRRV